MSSLSPYVLIAEPHAPTARALSAALTEATGLPCEVAPDGHVAHELLLGRGVPRGLVTNLVLARRDGFALMRSLRKLDRERQVPIVAFAAQPQFRRTAESYRVELGPMQVLEGPPPPTAVVRALALSPDVPASPPPVAPARPQGARGPVVLPPVVLPPAPRAPAAPAQREATRLARIDSMHLVDNAPPDADLQELVDSVARTFRTPTAAITLLLENKLLFKAHTGVTDQAMIDNGVPREASFCRHVVEGGEPVVVSDMREHPVFGDLPAVAEGGVVGYAGAPLVTSQGDILGALCVMDTRPLDLGPQDVERLRMLARRMTGELELRAARRAPTPPPIESEYEPISLLPMPDEPTPPPLPPRAPVGATAPSPGAPPPPRAITAPQGPTVPSPGVAMPATVAQPGPRIEPVREAETTRPASPRRPAARRTTSSPETQDAPPFRPTLRSDVHRTRTAPGVGPVRDEQGNLVPDETARRADTRPEGIRPATGTHADEARRQAETVPAPSDEEGQAAGGTNRNAATVPVGPRPITARAASTEGAQRRLVLSALEVAMGSLPCPILVFDRHRRTLFANDACCRFFEVSPGTLTGVSRSVILARLSDRLLEPEDAMSRLAVPSEGPFALHERLPLRDPPGAALCWTSAPLPLVGGEVQVASISEA